MVGSFIRIIAMVGSPDPTLAGWGNRNCQTCFVRPVKKVLGTFSTTDSTYDLVAGPLTPPKNMSIPRKISISRMERETGWLDGLISSYWTVTKRLKVVMRSFSFCWTDPCWRGSYFRAWSNEISTHVGSPVDLAFFKFLSFRPRPKSRDLNSPAILRCSLLSLALLIIHQMIFVTNAGEFVVLHETN